ncbi:MAG: MoaD/ThiS family protein [Candidatus Lokiarchaeota archaeon]|nr:MoaD/ThiS family protein [Candidatus Lokiarchaeota archaeon]
MTILVKVFGDLRKKIEGSNVTNSLPLNKHIESDGIETISDILNKFAIEKEETSHLFVNGMYSGFNKKVKDGDRVGLFPKNMSVLYKWYFTRNEDE